MQCEFGGEHAYFGYATVKVVDADGVSAADRGRLQVCDRGESGVRAERDLRVRQQSVDGEGLPGDA